MANFTNNPKLGARYLTALQFAFNAHANQIRKLAEVPYISHLMAVSSLVLEAGGTEDEAIAALLHDCVEDVGVVPEFLLKEFGDEVYSIVLSVSENKLLPKSQRKQAYVNEVARRDVEHWRSVGLVSCADKLHNLRSYATTGIELFSEETMEFYKQLVRVYASCESIPCEWITEMVNLLDFICMEKFGYNYPLFSHSYVVDRTLLTREKFLTIWQIACMSEEF